ncbi:UDP-glucuronic acid decarboxylase family protein [Candidatus Dependentiae bacterium]
MKKVLVTGCAGFLGSNLCRALLSRGEFVIALDDFSTGSLKNLKEFVGGECFWIFEHDVCKPIPLKNIDQIYHLACPASPPQYQLNPVKTLKTNVLGSLNVLELALENNAKVLQASTSEVYGDPHIHPQKETYWGNVNTVGPRSCYDEGKRAAETLFSDFYRQHGVSVRIARIFNTYGPLMSASDGRVVSNFIVQALEGRPITIYGEGSQTRSFCYVDDMIVGLIKLMNHKDDFIFPTNIGNPSEVDVLTLAKLILDLTESDSQIIFEDLPEDDPSRRCPDISCIETMLGWKPQVALVDGLKKTICYFANLLNIKVSRNCVCEP